MSPLTADLLIVAVALLAVYVLLLQRIVRSVRRASPVDRAAFTLEFRNRLRFVLQQHERLIAARENGSRSAVANQLNSLVAAIDLYADHVYDLVAAAETTPHYRMRPPDTLGDSEA